MNKALLVHIITAITYVLAVLYVLGGNSTDSYDRCLIVFVFVFSQVWCALICNMNGYYNKKQ